LTKSSVVAFSHFDLEVSVFILDCAKLKQPKP